MGPLPRKQSKSNLPPPGTEESFHKPTREKMEEKKKSSALPFLSVAERWLKNPAGELLCRSSDDEAEAEDDGDGDEDDDADEDPILAAISLRPCDLCKGLKLSEEGLTLQLDSEVIEDESPEK